MSKRYQPKAFFTLVQNNEKFGLDCVTASMSWNSRVIMGEGRHAYAKVPEGVLFVQRGSRKNYNKFARVIEAAYPGVCKFDYKVK